jgi:hypothetical protein
MDTFLREMFEETQKKKISFSGELKMELTSFIICEILAKATLKEKRPTLQMIYNFFKDKRDHLRSKTANNKLSKTEAELKTSLNLVLSAYSASDRTVLRKLNQDIWQLRSTVFSKSGTKFRESFFKWFKIELLSVGAIKGDLIFSQYVEKHSQLRESILKEGMRKRHREHYILFLNNCILPNYSDITQVNELEAEKNPFESSVFENIEAWGLTYTVHYLQSPNEPLKMSPEVGQLFCNLVKIIRLDREYWKDEQSKLIYEDELDESVFDDANANSDEDPDFDHLDSRNIFNKIKKSGIDEGSIDYGSFATEI